jgi:hypothetical protein
LEIGRSHGVPNQWSIVGFIVGSELTKFNADVNALLLLASCQVPGHEFGCAHSACQILSSEAVGMSHTQFPPPQQCHEWSDFDPNGRSVEFVRQSQELCSLWVSLCCRHRKLMCDRS